MEIREPRSKTASAGMDWASDGFSVAARSLQSLAEDISSISAANFERNAKLIDDLRKARTVEDIISIQTKFMAGMFEAFNDHIRLVGARMAEVRDGVAAPQSPSSSAEAATDAAASGFNQAMDAANVAALASLKASHDMTRSAFEAAEKAADTIRNAAQSASSTDQASAGGEK